MVTFSPTNTAITYIGRWADLTINSTPTKSAISGGNRFRVKFTGTSIALNFKVVTATTNYPEIEYSIDGGSYNRISINTAAKTLTTGLTNTEHTLEVWVAGVFYGADRWNTHEGVMLQGIVVDNGCTLKTWPTHSKGRMITVGDSIAESLSAIPPIDGLPHSYDGRGAFANRVAEMLSLDNWNVAFGGSGFYGTNQDGSGVPETEINYDYMMNGVPQQDPPFDIVVIEAGHNDNNAKINSVTFQARYSTLIDKIRTKSPNAQIFCMSPLSPYSPERKPDIQAVASAKGCNFVDTSSWTVEMGSNNHPTTNGHLQMANYWKPILEPYVPKHILKDDSQFGKVFTSYSSNPLVQIPRIAGTGNGAVHPDVIPMPGQPGKYLMVYTPFPPEDGENPWLVTTTDKYNFTTIGPTPQIAPNPNVWYRSWHLADTAIIYVPEHHKYYLFFAGRSAQQPYCPNNTIDPRTGKNVSGYQNLCLMTATDDEFPVFREYTGNPVVMPKQKWLGSFLRAVAVIWNRQKQQFEAWFDSNPNDTGETSYFQVGRMTSPDGISWTIDNNPVINLTSQGLDIWHINVGYLEGHYWMYAPVGHINKSSNWGNLHLFHSQDGINWTEWGMVIKSSDYSWLKYPYRPSFVFEGTKIHLWTGGWCDSSLGDGVPSIAYFGSDLSPEGQQALTQSINDYDVGGKIIGTPLDTTEKPMYLGATYGQSIYGQAIYNELGVGTPLLGVNISVSPGVATAQATAPIVGIPSVINISVQPATATAQAKSPTISVGITIGVSPASIVAQAIAPNVSVGTMASIQISPATINAQAIAPNVSIGVSATIQVIPASANAMGIAPTIYNVAEVDIRILPSVATTSNKTVIINLIDLKHRGTVYYWRISNERYAFEVEKE